MSGLNWQQVLEKVYDTDSNSLRSKTVSGGGGGGTGDASADNQVLEISALGDIATLVTAANALLTAIGANTDGLEGFVDGVEGLLTTIKDNADNLESYTDGLETLIGATNTLATAIDGHVDQLEGYTDGLEGLITSLNGYVDGLETLATATNTKLDSANTTLSAIDTLLDSIRTKMNDLATSAKQDTGNASLTSIDGKLVPDYRTVTGNIDGVVLGGHETLDIDCAGFSTIMVHLGIGLGGSTDLAGGTNFFGSIDGTTFTYAVPSCDMISLDGQLQLNYNGEAGERYFAVPCAGLRKFRLSGGGKAGGAAPSGIAVAMTASKGPYILAQLQALTFVVVDNDSTRPVPVKIYDVDSGQTTPLKVTSE